MSKLALVINDLGVVWSMKRKLYSYQRWSSAVQKDGTTEQRQNDAAQRYALENGYEMVSIIDDGISAFKSMNAGSNGALGQFLEAVENGFIPNNSVLYVESLDRISRDKPMKAVGLFNDILELGITIVTGMDRKVYTQHSINDGMELLQSLFVFIRAHEESKTKQNRTYGAALALIKRHHEGEPVTIKAIGSHPWWIDASTGQHERVRKHPENWAIALQVMERFCRGESAYKVTRWLNETYPKQIKGKAWSRMNVEKLKRNKAVYGVRELEFDGTKHTLKDYFPALISETEYIRMQLTQESNKYLGDVYKDGSKKNNINLLCGMRLFRCGHCGGTMIASAIDRKGNGAQRKYITYSCERGRAKGSDCKVWSIADDVVDHCLMAVLTIAYIKLTQEGNVQSHDYGKQVEGIEEAIQGCDTGIVNLTAMVERGIGNIESTFIRIQELQEQRKNLLLELDVAKRKQSLADTNSFTTLMMDYFTYAQYGVMQDITHDYRMKLRDIVLSCMDDVRVWKFERRLTIALRIKDDEMYHVFQAGEVRNTYTYTYTTHPTPTGEVLNDHNVVVLPQEVKTRHNALQDASRALLSNAFDMLKTVHYPDLEGDVFFSKK